jgi:hypothetical protein
MKIKGFFFFLLLLYGGYAQAQELRDSVKIYFRQGYSVLDLSRRNNKQSLDRIADSLKTSYADSVYQLRRIMVVGGASPEGSIPLNRRLSVNRAKVLFNYLSRYGELPDSLKTNVFLGRDWNGLIRLVKDDENLPYREETMELLYELAEDAANNDLSKGDHLRRMQRLRGGEPYWYMYRKYFPELRASRLYLWYEKVWNPLAPVSMPPVKPTMPQTRAVEPMIVPYVPPQPRKWYMAVKTNMLYDALLVPNIGVEVYLGKDWSVAANWMYAWWKTDRRHWYWRTYGGDLSVRKWLGKAAKAKPLTGHHLGVYGQIFTYDFETGGKGYIGGKPGGTLWDKMNYSAGVEYGYSLPVAYRLNIDFSIAVGYWGGTYYEYKPVDNCYVWQSTKERHWFGPTKAEVSLVWLIGRGNFNEGKGGRR